MWQYAKSRLYGAVLVLAVIGVISPVIAVATRDIQTSICNDFAAPTITSPAPGLITQASSVIVTGWGEPSLPVVIIDNGMPFALTTVSPGGDYSVSIPLSGGANVIVAKGVNACGSAKESSLISVQRNIIPSVPTENTIVKESSPAASIVPITSMQPPSSVLNQPMPSLENSPGFSVPTIDKPLSSATYTISGVWVAGAAEPLSLVTIYINDMSVARLRASSTGTFGAMAELNEGRNRIQVEAEKDGESAVSQATIVTYTPSKSAEKSAMPLEVVGLVAGMAVAAVAVTGGGMWIAKFVSTRRLR